MTAEIPGPSGAPPPPAYPARLNIDYVDGNRDRLTVFFRLLMAIPIVILIGGIGTNQWSTDFWQYENTNWDSQISYTIGGVSLLVVPVLLMIVFRQKYPRWWFDFNVQLVRFSTRVSAYIGLLTDEYPSTDEEQSVHIEIDYPDATRLNRWLPLVKWILAVPHYVVLILLFAVAIVVLIIGWLIILFTGRFPRGFHDFFVGVSRWTLRVQVYAFLLTTDEYPPFSLD